MADRLAGHASKLAQNIFLIFLDERKKGQMASTVLGMRPFSRAGSHPFY